MALYLAAVLTIGSSYMLLQGTPHSFVCGIMLGAGIGALFTEIFFDK